MVQRGRTGAPGMIQRTVERCPGALTTFNLRGRTRGFPSYSPPCPGRASLLTPLPTQVGVLGLSPHPNQVEEVGQGLFPFHHRTLSYTWSYNAAKIEECPSRPSVMPHHSAHLSRAPWYISQPPRYDTSGPPVMMTFPPVMPWPVSGFSSPISAPEPPYAISLTHTPLFLY